MLKRLNFALQSGRVLMIGILFIILQGCTTPFVNVEVGKDLCAKGQKTSVSGDETSLSGDGGPTGCNGSDDLTTTVNHDGLTCQPGSGSHICLYEGASCNRTNTKWCDTVQVSGGKCGCICTSSPN